MLIVNLFLLKIPFLPTTEFVLKRCGEQGGGRAYASLHVCDAASWAELYRRFWDIHLWCPPCAIPARWKVRKTKQSMCWTPKKQTVARRQQKTSRAQTTKKPKSIKLLGWWHVLTKKDILEKFSTNWAKLVHIPQEACLLLIHFLWEVVGRDRRTLIN